MLYNSSPELSPPVLLDWHPLATLSSALFPWPPLPCLSLCFYKVVFSRLDIEVRSFTVHLSVSDFLLSIMSAGSSMLPSKEGLPSFLKAE
jgi:hypothetical protein